MNTAEKTVRVDAVFRALSDQTRLRILNLLQAGERCVCELVDLLGVPQPTASRHLAYLRKVGLVAARKEGHWSYYRLAPARGPFFEKLLACLAVCCQELPQLARDQEQLKSHGRSRSCCD
jgi:ArsR family transcriptional regulator, arsenate/arsenite/antimonite-responsive transcriptional repressor